MTIAAATTATATTTIISCLYRHRGGSRQKLFRRDFGFCGIVFPKLKNGHVLTTPLTTGDKPNCIYFAKELNQIPDQIQVGDLV